MSKNLTNGYTGLTMVEQGYDRGLLLLPLEAVYKTKYCVVFGRLKWTEPHRMENLPANSDCRDCIHAQTAQFSLLQRSV